MRLVIHNKSRCEVYLLNLLVKFDPVGIYLFKVNNRNTRTRCKTSSKLTTKTPKLLLTLNIFHTLRVSIVNFEQVNAHWGTKMLNIRFHEH